MFYINIIKVERTRDVVAICDAELLGQIFEEDKKQLNVKESFYRGKEDNESISEEKALEILKDMKAEDATFNIVGENSIELAIQASIIDKNSVGEINGVKFGLVLL